MNKFGKKINWVLGVLFAGYWAYTLLSVICLNRNVAYKKRTYEYSNFVPTLLAVIILAVIFWAAGKKVISRIEKIEKKKFYLLLIVMDILVFGVQMYLMTYLSKPIRYDFQRVRETAIKLAEEHTFINQAYFNYYRMNRNILFVFAMLVKIFNDWQPVIVIGLLLVNLSVFFSAQICYKLTGKKSIAFAVYLIGVFMFDFAYRSFVPYTDNYGVFFLTAFLFVFINWRDKIGWNIISVILLAIGCYIKITVAILVIAGGIVILCLQIKDKKKFIKQAAILCLVFVCTFGGIMKMQNSYFEKNGFVDDPSIQRGLWHYFMMGQKDAYLGAVNVKDIRYTDSFATVKERNAANREKGIKRIKNRGLVGNLFFYTYKNFQNYNDGCFSPVQSVTKGEEKYGNSLVEKIFIKKKAYNRYYALMEQTLWLLVLSCIMFAGIKTKNNSKTMLYLKLVILGVSAYTMIFESRPKYLFMFIPVYLILAGLGLNELNNKRKWIRKIS